MHYMHELRNQTVSIGKFIGMESTTIRDIKQTTTAIPGKENVSKQKIDLIRRRALEIFVHSSAFLYKTATQIV